VARRPDGRKPPPHRKRQSAIPGLSFMKRLIFLLPKEEETAAAPDDPGLKLDFL